MYTFFLLKSLFLQGGRGRSAKAARCGGDEGEEPCGAAHGADGRTGKGEEGKGREGEEARGEATDPAGKRPRRVDHEQRKG